MKNTQVAHRDWIFSLFALRMESRVAELKKQSFKNALGLLADERRQIERACWEMIIASQLLYVGKSCELLLGDQCTTTRSVFYGMNQLANQLFF